MLAIYDKIVEQLDGNETIITKKYTSTISRLPQEHINNIYLLILHYSLTHNKSSDSNSTGDENKTKYEIPYTGRTGSKGRGVTFKLRNFPEELQHIITCYIDVISQ